MPVKPRFLRMRAKPRALECVLLFGGVPLALPWLVPPMWWPWLLAAASVACLMLALHRSPALTRCWLHPLHAGERALLPMLAVRFVLCALALVALLAVWMPDRLFNLPREQTRLWLALLVAYPLFSVVPQEVIYRYLFRLRYRKLFAKHALLRGWVWPSAIAFAWLHVALANVIAPLLCLAGGFFFSRTYERSHSLRLAMAEHTLYGTLVFTVGLAEFFHHDGAALLRTAGG